MINKNKNTNYLFDDFQEFIKKMYYNYFKMLVVFSVVMLSVVFFVTFYFYNDYSKKIKSSNDLIAFINNKNDDFMNKKQHSSYELIKKFINNKKNPSVEKFDEFSQLDEFLFKNLFFFAKKLYFNTNSDFDNYYEIDTHPWCNLIMKVKFFHEKNFSILEKITDDLSYFNCYVTGLIK